MPSRVGLKKDRSAKWAQHNVDVLDLGVARHFLTLPHPNCPYKIVLSAVFYARRLGSHKAHLELVAFFPIHLSMQNCKTSSLKKAESVGAKPPIIYRFRSLFE
jgi:hypothetical protein